MILCVGCLGGYRLAKSPFSATVCEVIESVEGSLTPVHHNRNYYIYVRRFCYMVRNESQENYLETILILSHKKTVVRSVDIANELGFKKPSISIAVKNMREQGLITVSPEGYISLTGEGMATATAVYEKHQLISNALINLGVTKETAEEDACRIEHVISEETFVAIKNLLQSSKEGNTTNEA